MSSTKSKSKWISLFLAAICLAVLLTVVLSVSYLNEKNQIKHLANYQKDDFYKNFRLNNKNQSVKAKGVITPHHLFANYLIEKIFNKVKNNRVDQVILIGPNHGDLGHNLIITSEAIWITNFGKIYPNKDSIKKLKEDDLVSVEEEPFNKEHSIYNILPYIKISFPKAKIVPIILKARVNQNVSSQLADKLTQITTPNTLIIVSIDFSHFQTPLVAAEHDKESIKTITNFDFDKIYSQDVDSPPTLYVLLKYLKLMGYDKFTLLENTNSGFLSNNPDLIETTSYITGYFQ